MMRCFFACFRTAKHRKCRDSANLVSPADQFLVKYFVRSHEANEAPQAAASPNPENGENPVDPIKESKEKLEEQLKCGNRKKVAFDLNVKTYEEVCTQEIPNDSVASNVEKEERKEKETPKECQFLSNLIASSRVSYPPNYRYREWNSSDDEYEGTEFEESDFVVVDDDDNQKSVQEETSESLFSISIESRAQVSAAEMDDKEVSSSMPKYGSVAQEFQTIGLNRNARDRSQYVHSVLNPIENVTQWREVKAKVTPPSKNQAKENTNLEQYLDIPISPEPGFKLPTRNFKSKPKNLKPSDREIGVDTSLSSWLVESEITPSAMFSTLSGGNSPSERANSSASLEDRPILGALTVEEFKQFSASSSPRRSPRRSPDDIPIIGTVGSYWSHTGQTLDSNSSSSCKELSNSSTKCREDQKVKWNSTPFETRLDRALDRGVAEA